MTRYEDKVGELREGMIGGKMSGDKLEDLLNDRAREGWQLRTITSSDVKGRVGPGSVEGPLVALERAVGCLSPTARLRSAGSTSTVAARRPGNCSRSSTGSRPCRPPGWSA